MYKNAFLVSYKLLRFTIMAKIPNNYVKKYVELKRFYIKKCNSVKISYRSVKHTSIHKRKQNK